MTKKDELRPYPFVISAKARIQPHAAIMHGLLAKPRVMQAQELGELDVLPRPALELLAEDVEGFSLCDRHGTRAGARAERGSARGPRTAD